MALNSVLPINDGTMYLDRGFGAKTDLISLGHVKLSILNTEINLN